MMKALERAYPYLLFAPVVSAALFFDGLLYPYLAPKTLLIRGVFILSLAALVALVLSGRAFYFDRLRNPLSWIPGLLLLWAYICSLFGIDFYHSFWSIFDRGDGLLTLTAVVGFFYFTLISADEAFVRRLLGVIAWIASLVALFSVLQWVSWAIGIDIPLLPAGGERVGGTLGNPTFLASFMGMSFFVTLLVVQWHSGKWRKILYSGAALQVVAVLASATRGTLLAMIVAGFAALLYQAWRGRGTYRSYARGGLVSLLVVAGLFVVFRAQLAHVPFEPISRLASISLRDTTVESRLFIWQNVVGEALNSPVFGVGAEHIQVVFNRFYDPTQIIEEWFDRTHNAFLDYLVQYGVPGLLLYLALIGVFVREALRLIFAVNAEDAYRGELFFLVAIVYAVQNFFVFDTAITLWLFLILFASLLIWRSATAPSILPIRKLPQWLALGAAALLALLVIPVSLMPLRANMLLAEAYLYQLYDARRSVERIERGWKLGTYADIEYGYQLYEWYTERQAVQLEGEARVLAYRAARDILKANYEKYPYDARTAVYFAHVLDMGPAGEALEEEYLRDVIGRAIELSPKRIQPRYLLSNLSIRKGDSEPRGSARRIVYYDQAIRELEEYSLLVPKFAEPRYVIATLYQVLGERTLAARWAAEGLEVYKPDLNTAKRASRYYVTIEDWENARHFLKDYVAGEPENYPVLYDLAKAEYLAGNPERAREIVATLGQKAPGLAETDPDFLRALEE
ncbi:hypothetical protein A3A39_00015 [Candidatus Kaiserbacteria bacterium RIFCSPLOWO2_01_FULL_54_13]|uniref:O-antigen ligase-related domain-containing protein n=1 Tax=Candidatus Kaiserbacteria bacterium RIFCSPLOWO2_01_FULL_54_13 TaxID=1798512 RepID=A0A1F6F0E5_9BACT|nr:MAG: hypothetical protein A3A39_00015 [Candidatus Kaiserbacteria bacterium RIFCSPLOWO2_01_FULL_54_13]